MARGSFKRRQSCGCVDASGVRLGKKCKRHPGSWSYTVDVGRDPDTGARKQDTKGGFDTKREAEAAAALVLAAVESGTWTDDRGTTIREGMTEWLDELAASGVSVKTLASYRLHARFWIQKYPDVRVRDFRRRQVDMGLKEVAKPVASRRPGIKPPPPQVHCTTPKKGQTPCGNWAVHGDDRCRRHGGVRKPQTSPDRAAGNVGRRAETRTASTVNGYRRTLRAFLSWCQRRDLVTLNVATGRMDSIPRAEHVEAQIWETEDTARFLEHVSSDRLAALYELAAYAGLRRAELCGLRWSDIDPDGAGLTISQSLIEISSRELDPADRVCLTCGGDHGGRIFKRPKSRTSRRWVPLVAAAQAALAVHRVQQDAEREPFGPTWSDHDLIFPEIGGNPIRPSLVSKEFDRHQSALGLSRIKLHEMRHGAASLLLSGGVPLEVVQMILGHSSPTTTKQIYAHLMRQATLAQVEAATEALTRYRREQSVSSAVRSDDVRPADRGGDMAT